MEEHRTPSASCEVDTSTLAKQIRDERERAGEYFSAQRETLARLERDFEERADALHEAISQEWSNVEADRGELDLARQALDTREAELEQRELQHQQTVEQFEKQCRKLDARNQKQETKLERCEQALTARDAALQKEEQALSARQGELDEVSASESRELVETQRKLNDSKSANEEAAIQIESLQSQREALTISLAEAEDRIAAAADDSVMRTQLEELKQQRDQARADVEQLTGRLEKLEADIALRSGDDDAAAKEIAELIASRDAATRELEQVRNETADAQASVQEKTGDLKRRLELAIEEIAELKARNVAIQKKLDARPKGAPAEQAAAGPLDWEAQKRQLLAELDTEFNQEVASERQERSTIEQTIEQTDRAMAEKDRQIDELKRQLDTTKSESGAAKRAPDPVPQDEASVEQRERLEQLEAEWKEKLRKAEIDLSVERAKIAREKAQLDQRMQAHESQQPNPVNAEGHDKTGRPTRGRWLARLGLSDTDE